MRDFTPVFSEDPYAASRMKAQDIRAVNKGSPGENPQTRWADIEPSANGKVGVGREKRMPIFLIAHSTEKSGPAFADISIHRLCSAKVWVRWLESGVVVGDFKGRRISSETGTIQVWKLRTNSGIN
jgi:hypothetical protein